MAHYEVLLFDADGTLFDFLKASKESLQGTMERLNIENTPETGKIYSKINLELWNRLEKGEIDVAEMKKQRFSRLFDELGVATDVDSIEVNQIYLALLKSKSYFIKGAEKVVEHLSKNHRIAIVTNGLAETQRERIGNSSIGKYFEDIFISQDIGYFKPDIRFFDKTFSELVPINKKKTLIIGDSLTADIQGGINACVHTCWFNPLGLENNTKIKPTYEIRELEELIDIA